MTTTRNTRARTIALAGALSAFLAVPAIVSAQVLGAPPAAPAIGATTATGQQTPGTPDWRATLTEMKLTPRGEPYAKKKHMEVLATTADNRTVEVKFDYYGRIDSVKDAYHRKDAGFGWRSAQAAPDVEKAVRDAGFTPLGAVATKKNHVEVVARNQRGEAVALHIDRNGYIYKQDWLR
jgi:hypothetical protein